MPKQWRGRGGRTPLKNSLFITEWFRHFGTNDAEVAQRIGTNHPTVWRWRTQQQRLTPDKMAAIAKALGISPEELYRPPSRKSVDAMLNKADDDTYRRAVDIVSTLLN